MQGECIGGDELQPLCWRAETERRFKVAGIDQTETLDSYDEQTAETDCVMYASTVY